MATAPIYTQAAEAALDRALKQYLLEHADKATNLRAVFDDTRQVFLKLSWAVAKRFESGVSSLDIPQHAVVALRTAVVKASQTDGNTAHAISQWFDDHRDLLHGVAKGIVRELAALTSPAMTQADMVRPGEPQQPGGRPITVCIYNNKGGIGKTTLAAHLCLRAAQLGIRTAGCAVDVQGDFMRWFIGREAAVLPELVNEVSDNLVVFYWPRRMPPKLNAQLLVIDMPPGLDLVPEMKPDVFLAPIENNAASVDNLMTVLERLRRENPDLPSRIYLILNKVNAGGAGSSREIRQLARKVPGTELWPHEIINSPPINRTGVNYQPVWSDKYAPDGEGAESILTFTDGFLAHLGFKVPPRKK